MAIQFKTLTLPDPELFGVALQGSVSRSDKNALQELADQALRRHKIHLILDLSQLTSLGGSGAKVLADFQRQLIAADGEAVMVGVGPVILDFLTPKFEGLPLRCFGELHEAVGGFRKGGKSGPDLKVFQTSEAPPSLDPEVSEPVEEMAQAIEKQTAIQDAKGLDSLLQEFTSKEARKGRRKDYHYTSLTEAVEALGTWQNGENRQEFAQALTNLLFSQGLAETVSMLFPEHGVLHTLDGKHNLPLDGSFAGQLREYARPLTILDLLDEEMVESETNFLEALNPEMVLPLLQDSQLIGVILLGNDGRNREYSVGESFAFELLMNVLSGRTAQEPPLEPVPDRQPTPKQELVEAVQRVAPDQYEAIAPDLHEVLYHLALELPDADDGPHFWRIFQRHASKALKMEELAFLGPDSTRPQVMSSLDSGWLSLNLGHERLQMFFRTMERPVRVVNLPSLFRDIKDKMLAAGVDWLISLKWEKRYQGMLLLKCDLEQGDQRPEDRLMQLVEPTARMLAHFDDQNDDALVTQNLVQVLMAEREVRCFGSDEVTNTMVQQLNLLAREMNFPPDQHRHLVYGCLLRDLGLVGQSDDLMVSPEEMTPDQLQIYYSHPERGLDLLRNLDLPSTILEVVGCHHERYNGQGYPEGLMANDIPLSARVVSVVENYVAMIAGVNLPEPLSKEEAARQLQLDEGGRFDPDIVKVFLGAVLSVAPEGVPVA